MAPLGMAVQEVAVFDMAASLEKWLRRLFGLCIPSLQGVDYLHLTETWTALAAQRRASSHLS